MRSTIRDWSELLRPSAWLEHWVRYDAGPQDATTSVQT